MNKDCVGTDRSSIWYDHKRDIIILFSFHYNVTDKQAERICEIHASDFPEGYNSWSKSAYKFIGWL